MVLGRSNNLFGSKKRIELNTLASEFLKAHTFLGQYPNFARNEFIICLLQLIETYPILRETSLDSLFLFCEAVSDSKDDSNDSIVDALLDSSLTNDESVKDACFRSLGLLNISDKITKFAVYVWIARFDSTENIRLEALRLWELWNSEYIISKDEISDIVSLICIFY